MLTLSIALRKQPWDHNIETIEEKLSSANQSTAVKNKGESSQAAGDSISNSSVRKNFYAAPKLGKVDCSEVEGASLGSSIEPMHLLQGNSQQTATVEEEEDSDDLCEVNLSEVLNNRLNFRSGPKRR